LCTKYVCDYLECPSYPSYYAYNNTVNGSCVQYCPFGTFSLDSSRLCVTTCPVYYYVNYTLNDVQYKCVASCPQKTFLNSSNFCVNATQCPSGYYGDPLNVVCTASCPGNSSVQMFANTDPNIKMCQYICPNGYYRQNISSNRTCVSSCLSNYYIDYVNLICVTTCPSGTYAYLNGSCLFACPSLFYGDSSLRICNTTCANGKYRDVTSNFCVTQCPPGYFGDSTGGYICTKTCSVST
jgi:proprotein convertase subtilisin/kexin type 5